MAFGTPRQLVLENAPAEELETVLEFPGAQVVSANHPRRTGVDGIGTELEEKVMAVAELSCADNETICQHAV